tara:strand:+ start:3767 stop:4546 length:780 start_codon:yes stop_codon:yes gene_type:complete
MSSLVDIEETLQSLDFQEKYQGYLSRKDDHLLNFLDNIDINKKYYRMNINKNKRYKKETTEDTQSIKTINSLINKLTDSNYLILKKEIIEKINVDYLIPYIIEKLVENSIVHHIYIPLYVGIIKEINSNRKDMILLRTCNKYYTKFFHEELSQEGDSNYLKLCAENKTIDNIIGFSLFISHLEKEDIINNYVEKVLDPFVTNLSSMNEGELFRMLVSFYNISSIHYTIIPLKYTKILNEIKSSTKSSKIKFKIMDILKE